LFIVEKAVRAQNFAPLLRFRPARLPRIQGSTGFAGETPFFNPNLYIVVVFHFLDFQILD
jgi:hypothetical protein